MTPTPRLPNPVLGDFLGDFTNDMDDMTPSWNLCPEAPRIMGTRPVIGKWNVKSEDSEEKAQLNYEAMQDNVLKEI